MPVPGSTDMSKIIGPLDQLKLPSTAHHIRHAIQELSIRGLIQSATWLAELLSALPSGEEYSEHELSFNRTSCDVSTCDFCSSPNIITQNQSNLFTLARSYFDARQYRRVSHILKEDSTSLGQFLGMYGQYLAGERRKEEERMELADWTEPDNLELPGLLSKLQALSQSDNMDAFLWYLLATILKRLKQPEKAIEAFVRSLSLFPFNRGAWLELASLCDTRSVAEALNLEPHWMRSIFIASIMNETEGSEQAREIFNALLSVAPSFSFVKLQMAISLYHMRLFDEAQHLFTEIYSKDEYCLDGVDIFSNILYVKEDRVQLSLLANKCIKIDKYRLETCCVIGNYFSLRGQHEQALSYFQRALRINRNYLSAWTLMGHEFLEMTNTAAAVEAYRRAVDINPKDFRAWYGLGQTYELLSMPMYTLYYYQKAASLRPRDGRMWCAVGQTYQELRRWEEATRCYERAIGCEDHEGLALSKLASLHERMAREAQRDGKHLEQALLCLDKAAKYHKANLERLVEDGANTRQTEAPLQFLAEYYFNKGDVSKAYEYAKRLLDCPDHNKDFMKTLLRQIHRRESKKGPHSSYEE